MNIDNVILEVKCPRLNDILRSKELYKDNFFKMIQETQIAVNDVVTRIRTMLMIDSSDAVVAMEKCKHSTDARALAKQVLINHGYQFVDLEVSEDEDFEYWQIRLGS